MPADVFARAGHNIAAVVLAGTKGGPVALSKVGVEATSEIKRILSQPGRGATYRRGGVTHRASSPGDPPAVDTGRYRASWDWVVSGAGAAAALSIGTPDKRGPWLEFGTSRMLPRPHLRVLRERLVASGRVTALLGTTIAQVQTAEARGLPRI